MNMNMNEKLVERIRALRRKAEDPSVTEAEAMAFMTKVQELLAANSLSMQDIELSEEQEDKIDKHEYAEIWKSPARRFVLRAVCRLYMCEAVGPGRGSTDRRWTIVGRKANVIVAVEMTDYLIKTTVRLSKRYVKEHPGADPIDFRRGCMARLCERCLELVKQQTQAAPVFQANGNPGNLPALYQNERQLINHVLRSMGTVSRRAKGLRQGADAIAGRAAAENIGLHTQIGARSGRLMIGR